MAVRVRVRIQTAKAKAAALETVAIANSGFESEEPEALLPAGAARRLGLWPPPRSARADRFASPTGSVALVTLPGALKVGLAGGRRIVRANAVISERENEVVLNDWLVDRLAVDLVAPGRGLYRVGSRGRLRPSEPAEYW